MEQNIAVQAVSTQNKKGSLNYTTKYFKKVDDEPSKQISHSIYVDLCVKSDVKVHPPIRKELI